jgi:hypothetical protein
VLAQAQRQGEQHAGSSVLQRSCEEPGVTQVAGLRVMSDLRSVMKTMRR